MNQNIKIKLNKIIRKSWKIATTLVLILFVIAGYWWFTNSPEEAIAGWWNESWNYRKAIVINHELVVDDLANFPVLISIVDTDLASSSQEDGDDIVFTDQHGQVLKYEIESYASSTNGDIAAGTLVAWVKIPELSGSNDTAIYMYYGNPTTESLADPEQVWTEGFVMVQHLEEDGTGTRYDSTANNYDGTTSGYDDDEATSTGQINGADDFDGTNDHIDFGHMDELDSTQHFTMSAWVKPETLGNFETLFSVRSSASNNYIFFGESTTSAGGNDDLVLTIQTVPGATINRYCYSADNILTAGEMGYWTVVFDGTGATNQDKVKFYYNGSQVSSMSCFFNLDIQDSTYDMGTSSLRLAVNYNGSDANWPDGIIDEARISSESRSAAWVKTEYNNQASTTEFISPQDEEVGPGPVAYWSFDRGYGQTAYDSAGNNNGTLGASASAEATDPQWQDESMCVSGKCLNFDSVNDSVSIANTINGVKTLNFWVKATTTTASFIDLNGTAYASSSNGVVSATGFTSPTIYINGVESTAFSANEWQMITITTDTAINATALKIGLIGSSYFGGFIDEVKIYPYARTADQIKQDYNAGLAGIGTSHGVSASFGSVSDSWMTEGLVGYWKFDESATTSGATDSSGNGNTGTYVGHASTTAGKFGSGGIFDGTGDYISIEDNGTILDFSNTSEYTWSAWLKYESFPATNTCFISKDLSAGKYDGFNLCLQSDAGFADVFVCKGNAGMSLTCSNGKNIDIATSTWTMITISYDGNSKWKIYKDGVYFGETDLSVNSDTDSYYYIGAGVDTVDGTEQAPEHFFDGQIDEVRIYNRALSQDEVKDLYNWAPGPISHWKFDEYKGVNAYDSAASSTDTGNNNGVLGGVGTDLPTWTQGKYGSALSFDGSNHSVDISSVHLLKDNSNFTLSAWIYPEDLTGSEILFEWDDTTCGLMAYLTSNELALRLRYDNGGPAYETENSTGNPIANTNQWYHISYVFNDNGSSAPTVTYYINGAFNQTDTYASAENFISCASNISAYFGASEGTGDEYTGLIDDVRIYNYARTQKQIVEDMNASHPAGGSPIGSEALYLKLDEGYGETAFDSSPYGNNGTLYCGTAGDNTATSAMWSLDGKLGRAVDFDGTDDYIEVASDSSLDDMEALTWTAWIYPTGWGDGDAGAIMAKGTFIKHMRLANGGGYPEATFRGYMYRDQAEGTSPDSTAATGTIALNTWQHVAMTYDNNGDKTIRLYKNTKEVDYATKTAGAGDLRTEADISLIIGGYDKSQRDFDGIIDEVKIYPFVLTQAELEMDYNMGKSAIMGSVSTATTTLSTGQTGYVPDWSKAKAYCVPGDDSHCAPPVLELKMDEYKGNTAYDTSGHGNDGTLGGGTAAYSPAWSGLGKLGSALDFDGNTDYIEVASSSSINNMSQFTISMWYYANASGESRHFLTKERDGVEEGIDFRIDANDQIQLNVDCDSGDMKKYSLDGALDEGKWHHITAVFNDCDGDNNSIILDGSELSDYEESAGGGNRVDDTKASIYIGNTQWSFPSTLGFDGLIDQVRIYNYVRTQAQIIWDYNRGRPYAYWRFDECEGGTIYDQSGNPAGGGAGAYNGTLQLGISDITATGTCAESASTFWYNGRSGKINSAGSFDGTDDYVSFSSASSTEITISAWVYSASNGDSTTPRIVNMPGYVFYFARIDADPQFDDVVMFASARSTAGFWHTPLNTIGDGSWYHVLAVYDSSSTDNDPQIYINGVSQDVLESTTPSGAQQSNIGTGYIGNRSGQDRGWDGLIDEVKIFNYALTEEQVRTEYNSGAVRFSD